MSLGNDFVSDVAGEAAMAGFAQMGLAKGGLAAVATTVGAGVVTVAVLAAPLALMAGLIYLCGGFDDEPAKSG